MSRARSRGFTLIEVLVALVIVAAGCAALLAALNSAARSTTYLRDKTFAQWIAGNRIVETRLATAPPSDGRTTGDVEYAGSRWQWQQIIAATELPGVRRIDVSVRPLETAAVDEPEAGGDWTATVSGVLGAALAAPNGALPDWEPAPAESRASDDSTPSDEPADGAT